MTNKHETLTCTKPLLCEGFDYVKLELEGLSFKKQIKMEHTVNTKFYEYSQNNSGGSFSNSEKEGIAEYVIIEALNAEHANTRAENIGLYFDGCDNGTDCSCCGDRWHRAYKSDGSDVPSIYGEPLANMEKSSYCDCCFVHYLDGKFEKIEFKETSGLTGS